MTERFDAIVVGARPAGSTVAMLLARAGWQVAALDRATFPSDTLSTHMLWPNAVARIAELGVLERLEARHRVNRLDYRFQVYDAEIVTRYPSIGGIDKAIAPRRIALDQAFVETAVDAGVHLREGVKVTGLLGSGTEEDPVRGVRLADGSELEARWVIGADGRASSVAAALSLEKERPMSADFEMLLGYWRGFEGTGVNSLHVNEHGGASSWQGEDDVHLITVAARKGLTRGGAAERERRFWEMAPHFPGTIDVAQLRGAEQMSPILAAPETMLRGFFRQASGPGWALVGDAGHFKHPITAQGISDALEQGIRVADQLIAADDLAGYAEWRDKRAADHYEFSYRFAELPERETAMPIFSGVAADPDATADLVGVLCRTRRPDQLFTGERMARWFEGVKAA